MNQDMGKEFGSRYYCTREKMQGEILFGCGVGQAIMFRDL